MAKSTKHKYWEEMLNDLKKLLPFQGYFRSEYNRMMMARPRYVSRPDEKKAELRKIEVIPEITEKVGMLDAIVQLWQSVSDPEMKEKFRRGLFS